MGVCLKVESTLFSKSELWDQPAKLHSHPHPTSCPVLALFPLQGSPSPGSQLDHQRVQPFNWSQFPPQGPQSKLGSGPLTPRCAR